MPTVPKRASSAGGEEGQEPPATLSLLTIALPVPVAWTVISPHRARKPGMKGISLWAPYPCSDLFLVLFSFLSSLWGFERLRKTASKVHRHPLACPRGSWGHSRLLWGDRQKSKQTWHPLRWDVLARDQGRDSLCSNVTTSIIAGKPSLWQHIINGGEAYLLFLIHIPPLKYDRMYPRKQCVPFKTFLVPFYFPGPLENIKRLFRDTSGERGQMPYVLVPRERNTNTFGGQSGV